jgi:hypothetical protein
MGGLMALGFESGEALSAIIERLSPRRSWRATLMIPRQRQCADHGAKDNARITGMKKHGR